MKRTIIKTIGIVLISVLFLPAGVFAKPKANAPAGKDKQAIQAERQAERKEIKAQRQAEKRAKVKAKVREHRIIKLQEIEARKEANESNETPAYTKIVNWLADLLGIK